MSRPLGLGLLSLGVALAGVMLLWLAVSLWTGQLSPGGAVLGLLVAAVLGLPLIGAGLFVLSRALQEAAETEDFETRRRLLESDRLFRGDQARELEHVARRLEAEGSEAARRAAARLRELVQDLEKPSYDQPGWYEAVDLDLADRDALARYEDLLGAAARQLAELAGRLESPGSEGAATAIAGLGPTIGEYEHNLAARSDLLRGRRAAVVTPGELFGGPQSGSIDQAASALKLGDAVSWNDLDYLVEATVEYFASGRTWRLHRLASGGDERWLWVSPGGLELAMLAVAEAGAEPGAAHLERSGTTCDLTGTEQAAATIHTASGQQSSATITQWRYTCAGGEMLLIERWPDGLRSYEGQLLRALELQIWPAASAGGGGSAR